MAGKNRIEIVERIVRNMPVDRKTLRWRFADTQYGRVRFAYGKSAEGRFYGVWSIDDDGGEPLMARPIEFANTPNNTAKSVAKELMTDAVTMLGTLHLRGITKREWWAAKASNDGRT